MVITVEPGCYFNEFMLRPALSDATLAHLLVPERIEAMMVRLHLCALVSACSAVLAAIRVCLVTYVQVLLCTTALQSNRVLHLRM